MNTNTTKYVVDPDNFDGVVKTSMRDGIHSDYGNNETIEQLRERESNPRLVALSWIDLVPLLEKYHKDLQVEFEEISQERYYQLFECLPPQRWKGDRFFLQEPYTAHIHTMCFMLEGKYYSGLRSILLSDKEIAKQIYEFDKKIKNGK